MNPRWTGLANFSSVFLRLALGISFLSAVTDRLGLWGAYGQPNVAWGDFPRFVDATAKLNWFLPTAIVPALAIVVTAIETLLGFLLILGWKTRITTVVGAAVLATFALTMTPGFRGESASQFLGFLGCRGGAAPGSVCKIPVQP